MHRRKPYSIAQVLVLVSFLVFLAGNLTAAMIFYQARPWDIRDAVLSDLQSPDDNPKGYRPAAAATTITGILLAPVAGVCYRKLRDSQPKLAFAGTVLFAVGLTSAIALGLLAPYTHGYTPLHIQLASAAFTGVSAGTCLHLIAARAAKAMQLFQVCALLLLIFLCYGPVHFDNSRILTSLALWEWVLCLNCAVGLWALAMKVDG